ncbi:Dihydrolipoyl dehydrogenase 3 [Anaplasma phagocytophilum]|uniref:dihydrolipoyl dehydrogenase n=1 Tax=Anaplasma phagocytophilum TaxID=948 RepID=UPI0007E1AA21|nr:dihydrolipoyl dehydrogenase [Anaplasma phagocytophilum]SCV61952.1 Dihydrolipoyl dehydrogenase 3 [Anaplasma phagocytophilum]SCV64118.1 Dihydrolipoyl dehydrogenase 3 [Anaplasma phagocytophilum]
MGSSNYDVAVIGAGPGGYKCAIKAAKLGLSVVCIDKNSQWGGTCLRVGCIPSKAMLEYSYKFHSAKDLFPKLGVMAKDVAFDLKKMFEVRDNEIAMLSSGIDSLFSAAGVHKLRAEAKIAGKKGDFFEVVLSNQDGSPGQVLARNVVLATGSTPTSLPGIDVDGDSVIFSDGALSMDVPKRLLVIGGGAIGLEMSSIWSRLGSEVTVVEYADKIASGFDADISKALQGFLEKQGIKFNLAQKVVSVAKGNTGLLVNCESVVNGAMASMEVDKVLVAVGRSPSIAGVIAMDGLLLDNRGFVCVNNRYETSIKGIYAIGDVIGGAMLAHKAEIEGHAVAELIAGNVTQVDYGVIPAVIYTHPAAASVGRGEESLKSVNYKYKVGKSSFAANGRARVACDSDGFVKVIACKETDVILGVHIVGAHADTMINEAAVALGYRATAKDICHICHSHPDVNEVFRDACEVVSHKR